jgi:hypothetical protein
MAKPLTAEPLTAAELLLLPCQMRFEGFLALVKDPDMTKSRGEYR